MLRVYELIRASGYTLKEIAYKLGITEEELAGNIRENSLTETLENIARILEVNVGDFFDKNCDDEEICGIVIFRKKTYKITSRQNLEKLYEDVHRGFYQVKSYF
ncbi:MAG: hypothetical protein QMB37_03505 [Paludibacteraceae bacterium]|nr:hypothetical protein [Paludibacteraceae bacterium]